VIKLMRKPVVIFGTVWFQPPNKFRREVKGNSPSITVSDGRELWIYYPNFKSAERYPLCKGSPLDATVAAINSALHKLGSELKKITPQTVTAIESLGVRAQDHCIPPLRLLRGVSTTK
jgi:outer membrane lipoprotein-sorting protein